MRRLWAVLVLILACVPSWAQTPVLDLAHQLSETADQARQSMLTHPTKSGYELQHDIDEAVKRATDAYKSPADAAEALRLLAPIEHDIGPLRTVASRNLHFLLGAIAGADNRPDDQTYHRAFALALILSLGRTGDGASAPTAMKVVSIREEYDWFFFNQNTFKPIDRKLRDIGERRYDVWRIKPAAGEETLLYFDVTELQASMLRSIKAREAAASSPAP